MDIPFSIRVQAFKSSISSLINQSGLPMCVIDMIMCDTVDDVRILAKKELEHDAQIYKSEAGESE